MKPLEKDTDLLVAPPAAEVRPSSPLSFGVFESLEAAESVWRTFEANGALTPYQGFDWLRNYCSAGFTSGRGDVVVIGIADGSKPVALLPLRIMSRFGVRVAHVLGAPISNSDSLIYDRSAHDLLTAGALRQALAALAAAGHRADIVTFFDLVPVWQGLPNPLLAFAHAPAPSHFYYGDLSGSQSVEEALPRKRRTNIRRSIRRLEELFGPVELRHARTPEEVDAFEAVFFEHRTRRFREMGVTNVFGTPEFRRFYRQTAKESLGSARPALRIHALFAGDTVVATSFGTYSNTHFSQQINSTTSGEAAKYTLTGVLMLFLLEELRRDGITSFDLGLGDFDYKNDWTRPVVVYDAIVPISQRGQAAVPAFRAARSLKRYIKQTPALWELARRVRAIRARVGRSSGRETQNDASG